MSNLFQHKHLFVLTGIAAAILLASSVGLDVFKQKSTPPLPNVSAKVNNPSKAPVIFAAGDIACGSTSYNAPCKQADTAKIILNAIKTSSVRAVLVLGDSQYEQASLNDFRHFYDQTWGRFYNLAYPVPGNHEYKTHNAAGFFEYFKQRSITQNQGYYSFKVGSWWFYAINSNCSHVGGCQLGSQQEQWFRNQLNAHKNDGSCQLMFMHYPYISSDKREFSYYNDLSQIWKDFYNAGGEIDLVGHSHYYERFNPLKPLGPNGNATNAKDLKRGITEFIVGTGGRNSYGFGKPVANSIVRLGGVFGVIKLTLYPNRADWQFISSTRRKTTSDSTGGARFVNPNQVLDSGTIYCH